MIRVIDFVFLLIRYIVFSSAVLMTFGSHLGN